MLVLLGVTFLTFAVSQLIPGDPARLAAGPHASEASVQRLRHEYGLDRPWPVQYVDFLGRLSRGDLGRSVQSDRPVLDELRNFFPATMELTFTAIVIACGVGIPLGVVSAVWRNSTIDHGVRFFSLLGVAVPAFWLGLLLEFVFYYHLGWLPGEGRLGLATAAPPTHTGLLLVDTLASGDVSAFEDALFHLALPAIALGYNSLALVTRMTRANLLDVLEEDFVRTAQAKGLPRMVVLLKHALRNALLPTLTIIGLQFGYLLGGTILVESIFAWPGMGTYALNGIMNLDFPVVLGVTTTVTVVFLVVNLLVDISYSMIDPRVRYA
jgi:peptide/nickel transport system permease protein